MSKRFIHNTASLLLSASLLVFALVAPGVRHAHDVVDGSVSKCHHSASYAASQVDHHHHDGLLPSPRPHLGYGARDGSPQHVSRLSGSTWHLHFSVLGVYFRLPDTNLPTNGEENSPNGELVFLHIARNSTPLPVIEPAAGRLLDTNLQSWTGDAALLGSAMLSSPPVTSIPLCDSARLERTGVRLA